MNPTWIISKAAFTTIVYVAIGALTIGTIIILRIFFKEIKNKKVW
jgi:hypothetical protein